MRIAVGMLLVCATAASALTPDERTLARFGIEPTEASIRAYLRSLYPDASQRARIDRLIALLGSRDPGARDHAVRELMRMGPAPIVALERAAQHEEPEVRRQAHLLLKAANSRRTAEVLFSVFRVIRARKVKGLAPDMLRVLPIATDAHVRNAARGALVATARPQDLDLLLRTATDGDANARMACFAAIREVAGKDAQPVFEKALGDASARVRVAAAYELANLGSRKALPVLVGLLDDPDEWTRHRAVAILRAIAQRSLGYTAGAPLPARRKQAELWRKWLAREGATVVWDTPVRWFAVERGRTLVATYTAGKIVEFDDQGKVVWTLTGLRNPWAVRGLANGHRLVSSYSDNVIYEYDVTGNRVWESARLPGNISGLDRLDNGNVIAAIGAANGQIFEIGRDKSIVSKLTIAGRPVSVRVLENGNLLVALHDGGKVVEIDRKGRVQWQVTGLRQPYCAERLPNGNVLVACYGGQRIVECDRSGAVVWQRRGIGGLYTAERLPDGSLIYANQKAVHRITPAGESIWNKPLPGNYLYLDRY